MKIRMITIWLVAAGIGMSSLTMPWVVSGDQAVITPPGDPHAQEIQRRRAEAWKAGGFRAAASVTGSYRVVMSANDRNADSVESIIRHSTLVVVGQVLSNRTWLNARGDRITTDYEVSVEQTLKGAVRPGDVSITMSVEGGKVLFEDGSVGELQIADMLLPLNGERYIVFLQPTVYDPTPDQRRAARGPLYMPSFGALSLYRISPQGFLTPKTFSRHRLFKRYAGKPDRELIDDVISAVEAEKAAVRR